MVSRVDEPGRGVLGGHLQSHFRHGPSLSALKDEATDYPMGEHPFLEALEERFGGKRVRVTIEALEDP